jgi:HEAT repeat protein
VIFVGSLCVFLNRPGIRTVAASAAVLLILSAGCAKQKPPVAPNGHGSVRSAKGPAAANAHAAAAPDETQRPRTAAQWADALNSYDANARQKAGVALRDLGKEGFPYLLKGMQSDSWEVRLTSLRAVPKDQVVAHRVETMPVLSNLLNDPNPPIRQYAAIRLGWLGAGARGAVPMLSGLLQSDSSAEFKTDVTEAIVAIHESPALLADLLRDPNPMLRKQAAIRLVGMGKNGYKIDAAGPALAACAEGDADPEIRGIAAAGLKLAGGR